MKIKTELTRSLIGVNQTQIMQIEMVCKTVLQEALSQSCRQVLDGGASKKELVEVYNAMLQKIKES